LVLLARALANRQVLWALDSVQNHLSSTGTKCCYRNSNRIHDVPRRLITPNQSQLICLSTLRKLYKRKFLM
jgi:hypothetical protein